MDPYLRRNALIAAFRRKVYAHHGLTWFEHQADWQLASEGLALQPYAPTSPTDLSTRILIPDTRLAICVTVLDRLTINGAPCSIVSRAVAPRLGGIAHHLIDLA